MKLAKQLERHDYAGSIEDFRDMIQEVRATGWPCWSDETLVQHPDEALDYCATVRRKAGVRIPDHVILGALAALRKSYGRPCGTTRTGTTSLRAAFRGAGGENWHAFCRQVERLRLALYPEWSDEGLMRRPREAKRFCAAVRKRTPRMSDDVILRALTWVRKQCLRNDAGS